MRVLVFGDSIAHGTWDKEGGGWVERLNLERGWRNAKATESAYHDFYNLSISGDTSTGVVARIEPEIRARKWSDAPFIVVVAIGTNDSNSSPRQHVELSRFRENLEKIVSLSRKFTDKILFVGLPSVDETLSNPWIEDESICFTNNELQKYEETIRKMCVRQNLPFVAIHEMFQAEQAQHNLLPDGLHPNSAGHELIANLVLPELDKLLR